MRKTNIFIIIFLLMFSTVAFAGFSVSEERKMGAQANEEVKKIFTPTTDPEKQKQLEEIGAKIVKQCDRHDFEYEFHVGSFKGKNADGYNLNAFAMPGGYVYFGEKLWNIMSESEREGIIAHEITHVDRKHSLKQMEKNQLTGLGLAILLGVTKAGSLARLGASLFQVVMSNNYSISDEKEADIRGTEKLIKAGMNPCGVLNSMKKIERMENGSLNGIPDFLLDHPKTTQRIKYLREYLKDHNIEIVEITENYKYPQDMIGNMKDVEYKDKKYKKLSFRHNGEHSDDIKVGTTVYIDTFLWDNAYSYKIPVTICSAEIINKQDVGIYELRIVETYTKDKIEEECVVALSRSVFKKAPEADKK
ncbi:MAG: M48 family metalloprotease [Abditibacteriota bacterium]|nr:M48 family metalloprotease [Abditibacteriota bacterium]